jgi:(E)-4-hydroxy-3-methyl-but-2-enyl pyrophosphate reductase
MKISIATTAGFCMGVRRAVEMVLDAPSKYTNPIYTYGPLIHNPQVLALLEEKGISILTDIPDRGVGTVLVRAHGVPPEEKAKLESVGFTVIDATCPRVIKVQSIIGKHARQGHASIIIGDREHPEVKGLLGFSEGKGVVVDNLEDLKALPAFEQAIVVAQTTQNTTFLGEVEAWIGSRYPHYRVFNTICDSTIKRQDEVSQMAEDVDVVIVVGGTDSGNTRRLAEIAEQEGRRTYHVESEAELDLDALASIDKIGITAGASTPNWMIKKVHSRLESLMLKPSRGLRALLLTVQRNLLLTDIYISIGAGCLGYACTKLQGITYYSPHALIAVLYVQSMHILNHLTGSNADRFNDPDRAEFYGSHRILLALLAIVAGAAGLVTAYSLGLYPFLLLLAMSIMGLSYNLYLIPAGLPFLRYRRIKDVPGSKTILIAAAWGIVTALLPALASSPRIGVNTVVVFIWAVGMVFVRTAFYSILDIQGDRIVGKETIPILLGERKSMVVLKSVLATVFILLTGSSLMDLIPSLGFGLAICPALMALMLVAHERGYRPPFIRLEFLVETNFLMAGAVTFIWYLI